MRRWAIAIFVMAAAAGCYSGSGGSGDDPDGASSYTDTTDAGDAQGGPCEVEACGAGQRCVAGECTQYPCYQGSCPSGYVCDETEQGGICLKDGDECTIDSDCPGGFYCENFQCEPRGRGDAGVSDGSP